MQLFTWTVEVYAYPCALSPVRDLCLIERKTKQKQKKHSSS